MIGKAHRTYGTVMIDGVIASTGHGPSDGRTLLLYAREVGVAGAVDLVPLFQTIDDLEALRRSCRRSSRTRSTRRI
ncbi:MAG: phosphoenolpyruvate carboxylase [Chloroflexi bacterium]|nr:phosphoenolpyruvate carboxylase [Chloroflexota bacterium]